MSRVLVCGGRDFADRDAVYQTLTDYRPSVVIQGGATGADRLAYEWARWARVSVQTFHANWKDHGKGAGPIRNQRMLDEGKPDIVIAFPGGRGTADMVRRAKIAGVEVREVLSA